MQKLRGIFFIILCSCLYIFSDSVVAADKEKMTSVINVYEATVVFPLPIWVPQDISVKRALKMSRIYRKQEGNFFVHEFIPKNESFAKWTKLYAVSGYYGKGKGVTLNSYINSKIVPFYAVCGKKNTTLHLLGKTKNSRTILVFCQNSASGKPGSGYGDGVGEIGLFKFIVVRSTFIAVYQEWRGRSFDVEDVKTWVVSRKRLGEAVQRFGSVRAFVSKDTKKR